MIDSHSYIQIKMTNRNRFAVYATDGDPAPAIHADGDTKNPALRRMPPQTIGMGGHRHGAARLPPRDMHGASSPADVRYHDLPSIMPMLNATNGSFDAAPVA